MAASDRGISRERADLLYDAFFTGAVGGSTVALFFLAVDLLEGRPLFTPSLLGSVLFEGAHAETHRGPRLDMVAFYSIVHFAVFGALGAAAALGLRRLEARARHPVWVGLGLLAVFELAFFAVAPLALPGVLARLGALPVALANALAAGSMALFLLRSHRPELWQRVRRART